MQVFVYLETLSNRLFCFAPKDSPLESLRSRYTTSLLFRATHDEARPELRGEASVSGELCNQMELERMSVPPGSDERITCDSEERTAGSEDERATSVV